MKSWAALLESLHSALVDELIACFPGQKLELGMPIGKNSFELPSSSINRSVFSSFRVEAVSGLILLAFEGDPRKILGISGLALWEKVLKRAGSEFARRGIHPHIDPAWEHDHFTRLPENVSTPSRVVWTPFKITEFRIYFGMGL